MSKADEQADPVGVQPASDEGEGLQGFGVQPLGVVDDAEQGLPPIRSMRVSRSTPTASKTAVATRELGPTGAPRNLSAAARAE